MSKDLEGMFDLQDVNISIAIGDGKKLTTTKIGKYRGTIMDSEGNPRKITLTNVSYVPELKVNLFSLTTVMEKNFSVTGTKAGIEISKGTWKVRFDTKFGTTKGHVFGAKILCKDEKENEVIMNNHAGTKLPRLFTRPKKAIIIHDPERLNNLQVELKKIDVSRDDEDNMKNQEVLPFELQEEEGRNEDHLEDDYPEEETIKFFIEDPCEDNVKLFEEYLDEYPEEDIVTTLKESIQHDMIEDIPINLSNDYEKNLKAIKNTLGDCYFGLEKSTDNPKEDQKSCVENHTTTSDLDQDQKQENRYLQRESTKQEGSKLTIYHENCQLNGKFEIEGKTYLKPKRNRRKKTTLQCEKKDRNNKKKSKQPRQTSASSEDICQVHKKGKQTEKQPKRNFNPKPKRSKKGRKRKKRLPKIFVA